MPHPDAAAHAHAQDIARDAERIAADVAALSVRLRRVSAAVTALIGGASGREDRTMTQHLHTAHGRSLDASLTLRQAAATVRRLGTDGT